MAIGSYLLAIHETALISTLHALYPAYNQQVFDKSRICVYVL